MAYVLVLVSSAADKSLAPEHLRLAGDCLGLQNFEERWLAKDKAAELVLCNRPDRDQRLALEELLAADRIDSFVVPAGGGRKKKLLISDMDNTMVVGETLDDLAKALGLGDEIARITARAMAGELDFPGALRTRVAKLAGLDAGVVAEVLAGIRTMAGARQLVSAMADGGAKCILVSGGFTCFTGPVAEQLGFHRHHGNILEITAGRFTGKVSEPILDHQAKLDFLHYYTKQYGLSVDDVLAVGDGANDLSMINAAGMGVGYHPKPYLHRHAENSIIHGDLTTLLYLQGFSF